MKMQRQSESLAHGFEKQSINQITLPVCAS